MFHKYFLKGKGRSAAALGLACALGACASTADYPSFAIPSASDGEARVAMRFTDVAVPQTRTVHSDTRPLPAELDAALAAINARAVAANRAFSENLGPARQLAEVAARASIESDLWAKAQLSAADLTTYHSAAQLALADLDQLTATAALTQAAAQDAADIAELQSGLEYTVSEQARALTAINAALER